MHHLNAKGIVGPVARVRGSEKRSDVQGVVVRIDKTDPIGSYIKTNRTEQMRNLIVGIGKRD